MGLRGRIGTVGGVMFGGVIIASVIYFLRFRVPLLAAVIALCLTALVFEFATLYLYDEVISQNIKVNGF